MYYKRRTMMPIQYVIGEWEFRDLTLYMKSPVLIPRNETSYLVELVNKLSVNKKNSYFLEIGVGTGAISLSILKENQFFQGVAIDKQNYCVNLTKKNMIRNNINSNRLQLVHQEYMKYQEQVQKNEEFNKFDFIVSNPPYIPSKTVQTLESQVRKFEDKVALDGGEDGLDIIKDILNNGHELLNQNGFIVMEVDITHNSLLKQYYDQNTFGWKNIYKKSSFHKDQYGNDRFCVFYK